MLKSCFLIISLILFCTFLGFQEPTQKTEVLLKTPFGELNLDDSLGLEILASPTMQRLRFIDQSGITHYLLNTPQFSRWEHSVGVYYLLKRYGASNEECLAGLLHDASHTVFSHLGDHLFGEGDGKHSYQDGFHQWYLEQREMGDLLGRHGLQIEKILPDRPDFSLLESDIPDLCADRLEYNLHTGILWGDLSTHHARLILDHLHFEGGVWWFDNATTARLFANLPLRYNTSVWTSPEGCISNHFAIKAIKKCIELGLITFEQMHFGRDASVLKILEECTDKEVVTLTAMSRHPFRYCTLTNEGEGEFHVYGKDRIIDPWVKDQSGSLFRLSTLDAEFASKAEEVRATLRKGIHFNVIPMEKN